jgi:uncharacterized protein (DUF2249 family)
MARELTPSEAEVLAIIEAHYGPQDLARAISWANDEAQLWVRDQTGETVLVASLTNLAEWRATGVIASDDELRRDWLRIGDA